MQISLISTQVDKRLFFFAPLIETVPALIEKSPKILNPKCKDQCLLLYLHNVHGRKLANLEHELQRNVVSRRGSYYTNIDFNEVDIRIYLPEKVIIH